MAITAGDESEVGALGVTGTAVARDAQEIEAEAAGAAALAQFRSGRVGHEQNALQANLAVLQRSDCRSAYLRLASNSAISRNRSTTLRDLLRYWPVPPIQNRLPIHCFCGQTLTWIMHPEFDSSNHSLIVKVPRKAVLKLVLPIFPIQPLLNKTRPPSCFDVL